MKSYNIGLVGAGNVGSHLCKAFSAAGHNITVFTRRGATHLLKDVSKLSWTKRLSNLKYENDFIIIAVNDDSIKEIAQKLKGSDGIILHTSGTMDQSILNSHKKHGVFYPLQSLKVDKEVDFKGIPLFIEANNDKNLVKIKGLAKSISNSVNEMKSVERKKLHLAAVVVNNFTNHLYTLSKDFLKENSINFKYLFPLIKETASRIEKNDPSAMQTGPAKRNDEKVIKEHVKMLDSNKDLKDIYLQLSESIKNRHSSS